MRFVSAAVVVCFAAVSAFAQSSDMFVTKTAPASTTVGSDITFTVTVGNNGPDDAPNGRFHDVLPADVTFVSINQTTGPAFTCTTPSVGSTGNVDCTVTSSPLAVGTFAQFDIVVNVSAPAAGTTLINTATAASDNPDDNNENDSAVSGTQVAGGDLADVGVTKTGPQFAAPGSNVTFVITVSDFGPNDAQNVTLNDTLGAGLTFVSLMQTSGPTFTCPGNTTPCTIATLPNGSSATFDLVATVSNTAGTYTNTASVTSANDQNSSNDSALASVTVASADVGVTKTGPATAVAGGPTYDYMITLSNSGPNAADNATFTDTLPAGISFVSITQNTGPSAFCNTGSTVTCSVPTLLNGESATFTLTVQPSSTIANGTVVTNTATASSSTSDTNPNNNSSSSMTTISANADLSIVKSGPATVNAGNNVTYTITVMDNGPSTASSVSWTDTLPFGETFVSENQTTGPTFNCTTGAAITCSIASLNPGDTATFTVVAQVSPATVNGTQLNNTANVSSTTPDGTPGNNTSIATTTVSSVADVSVVKSAPAAATAGSNVTYTITVMNNGPSNASSVTLTDTLPPGTTFVSENQTSGPAFNCTTGATITCSIATLNAGDTAIFSVTVNFNGSLANGTTVTNTATVTSTTADSNPANNTSSAPTLVSANADLSVTKSGPATTPSNTTVVYTVTAANGGSSTATNVTLTETVPAGMTFVSVNQTTGPAFSCNGSGPVVCTIASFNSGASATFQFTFNVPLSTPAGTQTTNTVTISSQTPDNNPANNTASVMTTVGASIPALSPLAMALLALMLAMIGWMTARR